MIAKYLKPVNQFLSRPYFWAGIIAILYGLLNLRLTSPTNVGYADSDELLTVAFNRGVAHPPGYPLYITVLNLFLRLPIPNTTVAFRGHLLSVVSAALTIGLVFLAAYYVYRLIKQKEQVVLVSSPFERWLLALITAGSLAFSYQFWLYSHLTEKYAFATIFVALFFLIAIHQLKVGFKSKTWGCLWLVLGLGISHLQSLVTLVPAGLFLLTQFTPQIRTKRVIEAILALAIGFTLPYLLIFTYLSLDAEVSWHIDRSFSGLTQLITRREFAGTRISTGETVGAYFDGFDINKFTHGAFEYIKTLASHWGWWILLITPLSLRFGELRSKKTFWYLAIAFTGLGLSLAGFIGFPEDTGTQAITLRQFIPGYVAFALLLYFGWWEVIRRLTRAGTILFPVRFVTATVLAIPLIVLTLMVKIQYARVDLSTYDLISLRYQDMFTRFEPGSVVTCYSDVSCFALLYERYVNRLRDDITVIPIAYPLVQQVINRPETHGFLYQNNPYLIVDAVTWNLGKRPVYAVELSDTYYNLFGIQGPFMYYIPHGNYGELSFSLPESLPEPRAHLFKEWLKSPFITLDPMRQFHQSIIGRDHILNGTLYLKMSQRDWSLQEFNLAANIFFKFGPDDQRQFTALRGSLENLQPEPAYAPGSKIPSSDELFAPVAQLLEDNLIRRAFTFTHAAVARDPNHVSARLQLAKLYQLLGDPDFARLEYQNTLLIDPTNDTAHEQLQILAPPQSN